MNESLFLRSIRVYSISIKRFDMLICSLVFGLNRMKCRIWSWNFDVFDDFNVFDVFNVFDDWKLFSYWEVWRSNRSKFLDRVNSFIKQRDFFLVGLNEMFLFWKVIKKFLYGPSLLVMGPGLRVYSRNLQSKPEIWFLDSWPWPSQSKRFKIYVKIKVLKFCK